MQEGTQTTGQGLKKLSAVEGVLRRGSLLLHRLAGIGSLITADLHGFSNLRADYLAGYRAVETTLEYAGVPHSVLRDQETIPPMPDLMWHHAIPSDPPPDVTQQIAMVFPEWVQAFSPGNFGRVDRGPTGVSIAEFDNDARDVTDLVSRVAGQGYEQALDCDMVGPGLMAYAGETVEKAVHMAAMYDLYLELRCRSIQLERQDPHPVPRRRIQIDPWLVGAGIGVAGIAAEVAAIWFHKRKQRQKARPSVSDLAKAIRKQEGEG